MKFDMSKDQRKLFVAGLEVLHGQAVRASKASAVPAVQAAHEDHARTIQKEIMNLQQLSFPDV